jgi:branched-chain amino acid transport system substrate-binding protein
MIKPAVSRSVRALRKAAVLGVVFALTCGVAAAGTAGAKAKAQPIKLGFVASFAGDYAKASELVRGSFKAWVTYTNAHGGILGRPIDAIIKDDQGSPDKSIQAVRDLVDNGVQVIEGPIIFASLLQPVQSLSFVNFTFGGLPSLSDPKQFPNTFLTYPRPETDVQNITQYAVSKGAKKWAVVYDTTFQNKTLVPFYESEAKRQNTNIALEKSFDPATIDFSPLVREIKDSGADGIFLLTVGDPVSRFFQAIEAAGVKTQIYGNASIPASDLSTAPKAVLDKQVTYSVIKSGILVGGKPLPGYEPFLKQLLKTCAECAVGGITNHFDSYELLKFAIEKAGGTDPAKIRHVLETQVKHRSFISPAGNFTCSATDHNCYPKDPKQALGISGSAVSKQYPGFFEPAAP